jgi:hypothetical protein
MKNTQYIIPYDKSLYRYLSDSYTSTLEIQQMKRYEIAWSEIGKTNAATT